MDGRRRTDHGRGVDAEDGQRRPCPDGVGDRSRSGQPHPVEHAGVLAELLFRILRAVPVLRGVESVDDGVAAVVTQRRQHLHERRERVRRGAAVHSRVQFPFQGLHVHHDVRDPPQTRGDRRLPHGDVAGVGDHDDVGGEQVGTVLHQLLETTVPVSSEPSDTIRIPTGKVSATDASARSASRCMTTLPLQSAAPRPYQRPPRSVSSNGGECQSASSPAGWMS